MISNLIPRQKLVGYRHRARTLLLLALLLLAAFGSAFAGQMYVGLHGGPNIPSLKGGTNIMSEGYVSRLGPNFGIFANYAIRGHFSLRGEINYSSEGGKRTGMQPFYPSKEMSQLLPVGTPLPLYGVFDNEAILDYLEIPVMAKMTWGRMPRLFAVAGPYVGFLVRAKTATKGSSSIYLDESGNTVLFPNNNFDKDTDIRNEINSTNYGIAGGVGIELPYGPGDLVFETRFSYGLTNIQSNTAQNGENNTGMLAFILGYSYPFRESE
jgi:hypothetical protein